MVKKLLITLGAVAAFTAPVSAADMAARPYAKAPVAVVDPIVSWSGFYIGADVGGQWSDINLSSPAPTATLAYGFRHHSIAAGGHAGYQHQWGQFVLGVEGAYMSAFDQSASLATPSISIFFPGGTGTASAKLRDIWSIGGRVGWAPSNWMLYATGGYASGSFAFNAAQVPPPGTESAAARPDGYYIGTGVEFMLAQNWILGVEYRHYEFNSKTVTGTTVNVVGFTEPIRFDTKTDSVMGRISYKFNWALPLVAKY